MSELSPRQAVVAHASASARLLVSAGPGTGKTHTLVARLVHLAGESAELRASEILVLSFTRVAVREIRERARAAGGAVRRVRGCTFDSFATWLLSGLRDTEELSLLNYDDRIAAANMLDDEELREGLEGVRHVIVDEVQDLVGIRAEFVQRLLAAAGGVGFTILGDPAQAIYGFSVTGSTLQRSNADFLGWVREQFAGSLEEVSFDVDMRTRDASARVVGWARSSLLDEDVEPLSVGSRMGAAILDLPRLSSLKQLSFAARSSDARTAVLCRTNGEALVVSDHLWRLGIGHELKRPSADRLVPAWVALLGTASRGTIITREEFDQVACGQLVESSDDAWRLLRRATKGSGRQLDLTMLRRTISMSGFPDELTRPGPETLVVSTVHRAKGREFDAVALIEPRPPQAHEQSWDDVRLLFVALTRATTDYWVIVRLREFSEMTKRVVRADGRWWRCPFPTRKPVSIEFCPADVCHVVPPGGAEAGVKVREYLRDQVQAHDPVSLALEDRVDGGHPRRYRILHGGTRIGLTSESLSRLLMTVGVAGATRRRQLPVRIEGLHVDAVETVAGAAAETERSGLGRSGMWLSARLSGLGRFEWREASDA